LRPKIKRFIIGTLLLNIPTGIMFLLRNYFNFNIDIEIVWIIPSIMLFLIMAILFIALFFLLAIGASWIIEYTFSIGRED